MKVLIVDDEPLARAVLRELLEEMAGVTVAGEATTSAEALEMIGKAGPDVLLLDIHMPGMDGLGLARSLKGEAAPLVIYVTAYEKHALAAFEAGAVDYLLKPVRSERLRAALEKARGMLAGRKPAAAAADAAPRRVMGRIGEEMHLIDPRDVVAFRAGEEGVVVVTATGRYVSELTLKELESRLPSPPFRRIHRAVLINTDHIRSIAPLSSRRYLLKLTGGLEAVVSRRMAGAIREATRW